MTTPKTHYTDPSWEEREAFVRAAWADQNVTPLEKVDFGHVSIATYAMRKIWDLEQKKEMK